MSVIAVANKIPKPRDMAIGIKNFACKSVSKSIGLKPAKVVNEVNIIGRNLAAPASHAAEITESPLIL